MDLLLLKVSFIMHFVSVIWLINAVLLILIILIQKGKGGGLGGMLGGGGGAGGLLGSKTGDFLTWVTVGLCCLFILLTVVMAKGYRPKTVEVTDEPAPVVQPIETSDVPEMPEAEVEEVVGEVNVVVPQE